MTYRDLAVRDAAKPLTWSFRAGLAKEKRALLLMGSLFSIGGMIGATYTVRFQCHRPPSGIVPTCIVTNGPVFLRETRDVAIGTFLVYDSPRRPRTRLCEATAGLEARLVPINELLAGLPPPAPP